MINFSEIRHLAFADTAALLFLKHRLGLSTSESLVHHVHINVVATLQPTGKSAGALAEFTDCTVHI